MIAQKIVDCFAAVKNHVFRLYTVFDGLEWDEALDRCVSNGLTLATFKTQTTFEDLRDIAGR